MKYHNITTDDMRNGDGLRVVLWVAGCEHHCRNCHNPITWDPDGGLLFDDEALKELLGYLKKDYISGLTFSGGDPLHPANRDECYKIAKLVKERFTDKDIWLYTGYHWEVIENMPIMDYVDVCVEGPFIEQLKDNTYPWAGSTNQRIIDVPVSKVIGMPVKY